METKNKGVGELLSRLKLGVSKSEFRSLLSEFWSHGRSDIEMDSYRKSKRPYKVIKEEMAPLFRYLSNARLGDISVRFPQDNRAPDCWLVLPDGTEIGVEVTRAFGRSRNLLDTQLVEEGRSRGFIPMGDDTANEFGNEHALRSESAFFGGDEAREAMVLSVSKRLEMKSDQKYQGMILLVDAPLGAMPDDSWHPIIPILTAVASKTHFSEAYLINDENTDPFWFCLKTS